MNADAVANHFYEQGRADAIKDSIAKAKNVNMDPRQGLGEVEAGGLKVKVLQTTYEFFRFKLKIKINLTIININNYGSNYSNGGSA